MEIEIIDIAPPEPPWLAFAVQRLTRSGILGELISGSQQNSLIFASSKEKKWYSHAMLQN